MRGDKTFAYDLDMRFGAVNGRVVLLLRSIEAKPNSLSFSYLPPFIVLLQGLEGIFYYGEYSIIAVCSLGYIYFEVLYISSWRQVNNTWD